MSSSSQPGTLAPESMTCSSPAYSIEEDAYLVMTNLIWSRSQSEKSTSLGLENLIKGYQLMTDRPVIIRTQTNVFMVKIPLLK